MNVTSVELGEVPHPGVGPANKNDELVHHAYYQWVPFFLFFQAIFFYIPHYLWRNAEGQSRYIGCVTRLERTRILYLVSSKIERKRWRKPSSGTTSSIHCLTFSGSATTQPLLIFISSRGPYFFFSFSFESIDFSANDAVATLPEQALAKTVFSIGKMELDESFDVSYA